MADNRGGREGEGCSSEEPPLLIRPTAHRRRTAARDCCTELAKDMWDRLFADGYRADILVHTNAGVIPAHSSVLGMASPVMKDMLRQSSCRGQHRAISIRGVPHQVVWVFLRFLYTSSYQKDDMNRFVFHLLVLSHVFAVPSLKKVCVQQLERGLLTTENVVDVLQLSQLCDVPRLSVLCHHIIVKNFKVVSATEGWKALKQSNPKLEKELLEAVVDADSRKKERLKKLEEKKIYLQLHEAMEALVHICRDGCRTIGPHDQVLRSAAPCSFPACKGLESLVRHFAGCKNRVLGGCTHCKRMWQLLELHSRLCTQTEECRVPLCRHFREKMLHQSKKDEVKWRLLVSKVMEAKCYSESRVVVSDEVYITPEFIMFDP